MDGYTFRNWTVSGDIYQTGYETTYNIAMSDIVYTANYNALPTPPPSEEPTPGDFDGDGLITVSDALLTMRYAMNISDGAAPRPFGDRC